MNAIPTIGGLPADMFIRRQVKHRGKDSHKHGVPAVVKAVVGDQIEVHTMGHKGSFLAPPEDIHPWWSKNPDLAQLVLQVKADENGVCPLEAVVEVAYDEPKFETESAPAPPDIQEPAAAAAQPIEITPMSDLTLIIKDHTKDWLPVYQDLQKAYSRKAEQQQFIEEIRREIAGLDDEIAERLAQLKSLGVEVGAEQPAQKMTVRKPRKARRTRGGHVRGEARAKVLSKLEEIKAYLDTGKTLKFKSRNAFCESAFGMTYGTAGRYFDKLASYGIRMELGESGAVNLSKLEG